MLPVSSWPPGPPGQQLSPFGKPRTVNLAHHPHGFVIPKGAWVVQTGANRVLMFRPEVRHFNPPRVPGTGILPGQGPGHGPRPPAVRPPPRPPPPNVYWITAQVSGSKSGTPPGAAEAAVSAVTRSLGAAVTPSAAATRNLPQKNFGQPAVSRETGCRPPVRRRRPTHDEYLEAWRAWQWRTGRTDPPIRPLPGRVPPNFFGWWPDRCAPATVLVNFNSGGTVLADGQNVVIAGAGFANITQAFSV